MHALQTVIVSIILGVGLYSVSRRIKVPPLLFYLLGGVILGPMGFGVIRPDELGGGLIALVEIAVAVILFEGGLSLSSQGFGVAPSAISRLLLVTIPVTGIGAALLGHFLLGLPWNVATIFGALIVVTGPTVINPLLKNISILHRLEVLLRWESIWGDVIGVLLSAAALKLLVLPHDASVVRQILDFFASGLIGAALGAGWGYLLSRFVLAWATEMGDEALPGVLAFASAVGIFYVSNLVMPASGPLAAAVSGFVLSQRGGEVLHNVRHFKDQLSVLFISTLFILLSASINVLGRAPDWWAMGTTAFALGLVIRPVAVFTALAGTPISVQEKTYLSLIGPRGIVALSTASYAALSAPWLEHDMTVVLDTTFLIIAVAGSFTTLLGSPLARMLGLKIPESKSGILLAGVNPVSERIADFAKAYVPVTFLETSRSLCSLITGAEHQTVCSHVLNDDVYEDARAEGFHRLVAISPDDALNYLLCSRAVRHFGPHKVYCAQGLREGIFQIEPIAGVSRAFHPDFYLHEAIQHLREGRADFELLETYDPEQTDLLPLLRVTGDGGLQICEGKNSGKGPFFCLRYLHKPSPELQTTEAMEG